MSQLTLALMIVTCGSCGRSNKTADMDIKVPASALSNLPHPTHPRAATASQRVRPELESSLYQKGLRFGDPVFLRAFKNERTLEIFVQSRKDGKFHLFRSYPVAAASGTPGPKLREGDKQVPEGFYSVTPAAMNPESKFHLSFNIGYPNSFDRHHNRNGSLIMIHGGKASIGCLAMTDPAIEEIYTLCDAAHRGGQPSFHMHIFPFRMTDQNLASAHNSHWLDFWLNLRDGHHWFEEQRIPPNTRVSSDGTYQFDSHITPKPTR